MEKLATIEVIKNRRDIPKSDFVECVDVLGFQCVVQKGLYEDGDRVVYIRTDTLLPLAPWTDDYRKYSPDRVRAVQLRKKWSEGIIVPLSTFDAIIDDINSLPVGTDVSYDIGVTKFIAPEPVETWISRTVLPYFMTATREERWENMNSEEIRYGDNCIVTLKIDGQSLTFGYHLDEDRFFIAVRGNEVKLDDNNKFTQIAKAWDIEARLKEYCVKHGVSLAVRGEYYGSGVSKSAPNPHSKLDGKFFGVFNVWNLKERFYYGYMSEHNYIKVAQHLGLSTVPILEMNVPVTPELIEKYSSGLKNLNGTKFEGVVVKFENGESFKIINKHYDAEK